MSIPRIFQRLPLQKGGTLNLSLDTAHYLQHVRRLQVGDPIIIFNGDGGEYQAQILFLKKALLTIKIESYQAVNRESPLALVLAQGIARGEKMDFIVQKAVELGITKIIPLFTERSNVRLEADKLRKRQQHWQGIAISACEQSGRTVVPEVALPCPLREWLPTAPGTGLTLSPHSRNKITNLTLPDPLGFTLLVGPEGGLSQAEVALAEQKGFTSIHLGPRILRTETAPLAAIALLQSYFGDL